MIHEPISTDYFETNFLGEGYNIDAGIVSEGYFHIVSLVIYLVERADLRDKREFHTALHLLSGLLEDNLTEAYISLVHPEIVGIPDPKSRTEYKSHESKVSRWINNKATPGTLKTRQLVIAAALNCLKDSVVSKSAIPFKNKSTRKHCRVTEGAQVIGIGSIAQHA